MVLATSSGVPSRLIGISGNNFFSVSGDKIEVLISPGAMAFTRIPCGPKSTAISRVRLARAALDVA